MREAISASLLRIARWIAGILLVIGGMLGFLPILGFWMIPLGLGLLAPDVPAIRRLLDRFTSAARATLDIAAFDDPENLAPLTGNAGWENVELFHDGDRYFDRMISEIDAAKESVFFEVYIFDDDSLGRRMADALERAARRGRRVRVMVDGIGSPAWPDRFAPALAAAGALVRIHHPRPWDSWPILKSILSRPHWLRRLHAQINRRNHRKVAIIDGRAAWLGSLNVSDRTLTSIHGDDAWRECGVRLEGLEVRVLAAAFRYTWDRLESLAAHNRQDRQRARLALVRAARHIRINAPRAMRRRHYTDLLHRIRAADKRIWIVTPYFVPTRRLLHAFRSAARRGVDVRLLLPEKIDHPFVRWVRIPLCGRLIKEGVRIFEFRPSVLHAKFLIIDGAALVGSSNLNFRSLLHDLEVDVLLDNPAAVDNLADRFTSDLARSDEITPHRSDDRPSHLRLLGGLLFRVRYWM